MGSCERPVPPVAYKNDRTSLPSGRDSTCQILQVSLFLMKRESFYLDTTFLITKELLKQCIKSWNFSLIFHVCNDAP